MNLNVAQAFLLKDQPNWRKPHLSWLPVGRYCYYGLPMALPKRRR